MLRIMRTTLEIDDDLMAVARKLATERRETIGSVVSALMRRALSPSDNTAKLTQPMGSTPSRSRARSRARFLRVRSRENTDSRRKTLCPP